MSVIGDTCNVSRPCVVPTVNLDRSFRPFGSRFFLGATGHLDFPVRRRRGTVRAHEGVDGRYDGQGRALLGQRGGGFEDETRREHDDGHNDEQLGEILFYNKY